ncbi:MAG: hypothetical protein S4CHLAM45_02060 [Chlamydiales bacterium]|nr:hypothetical protein [Chlamydiales bacterium]MCH9620343.1 hypothetical protein [Chlamydiales bacterium]MCH9622329.1 hypothetical protein [Chlamydiales bacterium]
MKHKKEFFSSRLGFIISLVSIAIGAGNIWRFSRIAAQNGGGTFLIPWAIFLFLWSIPLIITELAMGKLTRKAPIGALAHTAGPRFAWMGGFIALVTTGILFYYSVVVGWGFRYFFYSITGKFTQTADYASLWENYTHSLQPLLFHTIIILIGAFVVYRGITKGIEKVTKILIPILLCLIAVIAVRAVTLPGAKSGLAYLFTPHLKDLLHYKIWIEALTQNAWDTGAGWGLLLVYANYARKEESIIGNSILTALTNNVVSLLMGVIIFSTAFAFDNTVGSLVSGEGSSNTGMTFIYIPTLFSSLPGGPLLQSLFSAIFFLAFGLGSLCSMFSMVQLAAKSLHEIGLPHKKAIITTALLSFLLGLPSALSMAVFQNQDWVWSLGLIVNGLFIAFGVIRYGVNRFRVDVVNSSPKDRKLGRVYNFMIRYIIPAQGVVLLAWAFYQSILSFQGEHWWNPFHIYSIGSVLFQWGIGLTFLILCNKWLTKQQPTEREPELQIN